MDGFECPGLLETIKTGILLLSIKHAAACLKLGKWILGNPENLRSFQKSLVILLAA